MEYALFTARELFVHEVCNFAPWDTGANLPTFQEPLRIPGLPVEAWHDVIDEPTFADATLDRIVHNAHRLSLDGHSMRKTHGAPKNVDGDAND